MHDTWTDPATASYYNLVYNADNVHNVSVWKIDDKICVVCIIVGNEYNVYTVLDSQGHPSDKY